jgi:hypothetical protein
LIITKSIIQIHMIAVLHLIPSFYSNLNNKKSLMEQMVTTKGERY